MARDRLEWEKTVLVANVHNGLWRLKRRRKRRRIHDCCLSCFLKCGFQCFAELVTPDIYLLLARLISVAYHIAHSLIVSFE